MDGKKTALITAGVIVACILGATIAMIVQTEEPTEQSEVVDQFLEICDVPRCSGHEEKIGQYLMEFASKNNLEATMDDYGNVMIYHIGTIKSGIILQMHQDMVPVVADGVTHDFTKDPITTIIKDGVIYADGTTLGADDGVGMAISLCALKNPDLSDIDFRCIYTVSEETTMMGANNINAAWLEGCEYLINIDTEIPNVVTIGCAGHVKIDATFTPDKSDTAQCVTLKISGLKGGHSGDDINKGRANAIRLMAGFLKDVEGLEIATISGGEVENSIPGTCTATFSYDAGYDLQDALDKYSAAVKATYAITDPDIYFELDANEKEYSVWTSESSYRFVNALNNIPNGVQKMQGEYVILSSTVSLIKDTAEGVNACVMIRGLLSEDMDALLTKIKEKIEEQKIDVHLKTIEKGWLQDEESNFVKTTQKIMGKVYGTECKTYLVHCALECGIFTTKMPGLQAVSIGADIKNAHSVKECVNIDSINTTYECVVELLKNGFKE